MNLDAALVVAAGLVVVSAVAAVTFVWLLVHDYLRQQ